MKSPPDLTPWTEIAAELGVTPQAVRKTYARAIKKMRRELTRRNITAEDVIGRAESQLELPAGWVPDDKLVLAILESVAPEEDD